MTFDPNTFEIRMSEEDPGDWDECPECGYLLRSGWDLCPFCDCEREAL
jgi:hypothetical protein